MKLSCIFIILIFSIKTYAYYYSFGTYVPYFNKAQINTAGDTQFFEINPYLAVGTQVLLSGPHYFTPEFGYGYYLENAKNTKRDQIFLHYNFSYVVSPNFVFRYGLTNNWYRLHGQGGSATLSNGNGSTTFPSPTKTVTTYYSTLDFGVEYVLSNRQFSIRYDLQMMSFKKLENKAFNYLLTFNYYQ